MKLRTCFLSCVFFYNLSAEVSITYINGFSDIFAYEINPVVGAVLWKTKVIENLYRVTSGEDNVLSNSAIGKLVHRLFYLQHDNVTFDCTVTAGNIETYFDEKIIGKALAFIVREKNILNSENKDIFIKKFQDLIASSFDLTSLKKIVEEKIKGQEKNLTERNKGLNEEANKKETTNERKKKIETIKKNNNDIIQRDKKFRDVVMDENQPAAIKAIKDRLSDFSSSVIAVLFECKEPDIWYEEDLFFGVFLAWLWHKSDERTSLFKDDKKKYARQYFYDFAVSFNEEFEKESSIVQEIKNKIKLAEVQIEKNKKN